jgi:hypothetical protein
MCYKIQKNSSKSFLNIRGGMWPLRNDMNTQAACNGEREPKRVQKRSERLGVSQLPFFASFFVHFFFFRFLQNCR